MTRQALHWQHPQLESVNSLSHLNSLSSCTAAADVWALPRTSQWHAQEQAGHSTRQVSLLDSTLAVVSCCSCTHAASGSARMPVSAAQLADSHCCAAVRQSLLHSCQTVGTETSQQGAAAAATLASCRAASCTAPCSQLKPSLSSLCRAPFEAQCHHVCTLIIL